MKIARAPNECEQSTPIAEEVFSIADDGMVQMILREKIYKNKMRVIPQEYACNARDAHREIKQGHLPIEIILPTVLDSRLQIIDHGPGITPERMTDVFLKYGASTKRDSNRETGGFGIGAKSGFAYSKSWSIITVTNKTKRIYNAYLNERHGGALSLVDELQVEEENGTTIIVPIQLNDIEEFIRWTYYSTNLWEVRPVFINGTEEYERKFGPRPNKVLLKGDHWTLLSEVLLTDSGIVANVDGVPYPIDSNELSQSIDDLYRDFIQEAPMILDFKVGELELSAGRESINYSELSQNRLVARVKKLLSELPSKITELVTTCPDYWEAMSLIGTLSDLPGVDSIFKKINGIQWNGHPIGRALSITQLIKNTGSSYGHDRKVGELREYEINHSDNTITSAKFDETSIRAYTSVRVVIVDVPRSTVKSRVATLFELDPNLDTVFALTFSQSFDPSVIEAWKTEKRCDLLKLPLLSTIAKKPRAIKPKEKSAPGERNNCLTIGSRYVERLSLSKEQCETGKGYYVEKIGKLYFSPHTEGPLDPATQKRKMGLAVDRLTLENVLTNLMVDKVFKVSSVAALKIHAMPAKMIKKLGTDWVNVFTALENKVKEWAVQYSNRLSLYELTDQAYEASILENSHYRLCCKAKIKSLQKGSQLRQYFRFLSVANRITNKDALNLITYRIWKKHSKTTPTVVDIVKLHEQIDTLYPLLTKISHYDLDSRITKGLLDYIGWCDKAIAERDLSNSVPTIELTQEASNV